MPITQDQMLAVVNAGEDITTALQSVASLMQNKITYEIRPMYDRLAEKIKHLDAETQNQIIKEYETLDAAMQDVNNKIHEQLFMISEQHATILRWRDHYKLRYKANLNSRRYHQRRQGIATPTQTEPKETFEEYELRRYLQLDAFPEYPEQIPTSPNDSLWDDYQGYLRLKQLWTKAKTGQA